MKRAVFFIFVAGATVFAAPIWAGDPAPFPDFTFKRMKVPPAGTANRITVQIDPSARIIVRPPEVEEPLPETPAPTGKYAWYWAQVSPRIEDSNSGSLENAVKQLRQGNGGPSVATPRLQDMQSIASRFGNEILVATVGTQVSPAFVLAVMGVESAGKVDAVSSAGAQGLMQLIPATAKRFGVKDSNNPAENIRGGVAYLDWLMNEFDNDPILVLAAYNAGENAVKRNEGVPEYAETRDYVPKVLAAWTVARGLCLTPPQLVSDGCVFAVQGARNNE